MRAREIFEATIEITQANERSEFLKSACCSDEALRGRVDALLQAHAASESFFPGVPTAATLHSEKCGDRIGPYTLIQQRPGSKATRVAIEQKT